MAMSERGDFTNWHLRLGWAGLLFYLALGVVLEGLHGFKAPWYLDTGSIQRRMLLTLAHSHGTLFSLVQVGVALTIRWYFPEPHRGDRVTFWGVTGGQVLVPLGFLGGGIWLHHGEAGLGVFLVPPGAACMLAGLGAFVWKLWPATSRRRSAPAVPPSASPRESSPEGSRERDRRKSGRR
jgi:hypothetical protein